MTSVSRKYFSLTSSERHTVGDTKLSMINLDHLGCLLCDGRILLVTDYQILFNVIRYTYGGSSNYFSLPNPAGRVLGVIGSGSNLTARTLGSNVGEETHTLTIPEMPSHNHGVAAGVQNAANNRTALSATGITVNSNATGITDSGHAHSYIATNDTNHDNATSLTNSANNRGTYGATTGTGYANINDPQHNHAITDPTHAHTLNPAGGDQPHNNMQPTLFVGNMFIYSGIIGRGTYPYNITGNFAVGNSVY